MKQPPLSIITAQQKFKDWRENKLPGEKIPSELWNIVKQILFNQKYKITAVTRGLGVNTEQLRQQFPEYFTKANKLLSKTTPKFVQASLAPLTAATSANYGLITIENKNGTKFILHEPTTEQFSIIIKLFME